MITTNGTVKVLDFGLAKASGSGPASLADDHSGATREGVILGTAAYMSPEQARGQPIDKRTDIWAFGCVLFEMFTGRGVRRRPFDTIAAVLEREPDWSALPSRDCLRRQDLPATLPAKKSARSSARRRRSAVGARGRL